MFFPCIHNAQVFGKLVDSESLEPISYAVISWNGGSKGAVSGPEGEFEVVDREVDSVLISAMAYRDTSVSLKSFGNSEIIIYLNRQTYDLPIIEVKSGYFTRMEFEVSNRKKTSLGTASIKFNFFIGTEFANDQLGYIESVSIFFDRARSKNLEHEVIFRLRILGFNDDNYPEYDLLTEFVEIMPERRNRWLTIDLKDNNVRLPDRNFLVAVEYIKKPDLKAKGEPKVFSSGWSIGLSEIPTDQKGLRQMWDNLDGDSWGKSPNFPIENVAPMIKVSAMVLKP
ncbi:MAG: hypothetical protein EA411_13050 [Saprospirales bacterium]|nr:MAG: hypothetical protein EA411_13050 [Saprospirales bacterium]